MTFMPEDNLAYTLAGVSRKKDPYEARRSFAQRIQAQGMDTSPIQSPWQGAARLAQALAGSYGMYAADRDEKKATEDRNTKLAAVMAEPDPTKRIGLINALDPELGVRLSGQMALDQAKAKAQREGLQAAAGSFGASYGAPQITQGPLPPPGGSGNAGQAIAGIESQGGPNGGYGAVGPPANEKGNRAYGKYQVLDSNIPAWTQEVLGRPMSPQEFLANPQAQDAVFQAKFGQYVQKYGSPQAASRAWFAGEGGMNNPNAADVNGMTVQRYGQKFAQAYGPGAGGPVPPPAQPVNVQATPPGQPQPLQINMGGPGGMPQGSADGRPPAPSPQGLQTPVMTAQAPPQAPAIPDVPRPQPSPQQIQQYQTRLASGEFGNDGSAVNRARAALESELDRDWAVQRDRAKMQFQQQTTDFADQRRTQREIEKDDRNRSQPSRTELEKLHTARTEAATIAAALNDFQREFQNTGTWGAMKSVAGATTPVNTAYNAAALMAKGEALFNLGVLNGPDLDIIRRTLPDPSTMKGATTSNQDMSAAVGKVIDLLQTRLASREKQLGLPVTDVRGVANELRATMPGGPTQQPTGGPIAPGAIEDGYRFKGGNPADKNSWERVQ